ncbi:MAG: sedoheptulose 7-phosphate cyclase [bacterium]|nr:sedoheptulose 7-phosphate cyclase [bacterium]
MKENIDIFMIIDNTDFIAIKQQNDCSYKVDFCDLFDTKNNLLKKHIKNDLALFFVDNNVDKLYGRKIKTYLDQQQIIYKYLILSVSEKDKNFDTVLQICKFAKNSKLKRNSYFVAVGGGITMDLVGFAASMFRRSIDYIRIPTTLVGIIDAGIGIKVGVNFDGSKNFLGSYYPPSLVINDLNFLSTLNEIEIRNGLYEIIKMGIIKNPILFHMIEEKYHAFFAKNLSRDVKKILHLSIFDMMEELEPNLRENILKRVVDFGHTFSMYIESYSGFKIPHGEAVGMDMVMSSAIAYKRNMLSEADFNRIIKLISIIGFSDKYLLPSALLCFKYLDDVRDHRNGNLNLVLPTKIGENVFTDICDINEIEYGLLKLNRLFTENNKNILN